MPPAEPRGGDSNTPDPARERFVEAARARWVDRLIDTSRCNNLLFYRPLQSGTIEIAESRGSLRELLARETIRAVELLPDPSERPGRILNIARKAQENSEEKGLQTLCLAVGFAQWKADDGGRDYNAPVFLIPLRFKQKGNDSHALEVSVADGVEVNPVLLHVLQQKFGVTVTAESLLPDEVSDPDHLTMPAFREALQILCEAAKDAPRFTTECSAAVGNFSFIKMAMVEDLNESLEQLVSSDLVAAIAGDESARSAIAQGQVEVDPRSLDSHSPDSEFCVVDADSSQQCAVDGIVAGQSAVVHGPPGTGKSQTITNLIASLVANGKTVLFVAEKRAALEVVLDRLQRSQLAHLAIDLHGAELSPKKVMERVAETLNIVRQSRLPDCEALHARLAERRVRLNQHDHRMHTLCPQTAMSLFDMQGRLLKLSENARTDVRWRGPELEALKPTARNAIRDSLHELSELSALVVKSDPSPWVRANIPDAAAAQRATDAARSTAHEWLPEVRAAANSISQLYGFKPSADMREAADLIALLGAVESRLRQYQPAAFDAPVAPLIAELSRGANPIVRLWLSMVSGTFKHAVAAVTEMRRNTATSVPTMLAELRGIEVEANRWNTSTSGRSKPTVPDNFDSLRKAFGNLSAELDVLSKALNERLDALSFDALEPRLSALANDVTTPFRLAKLASIESQLQKAGVQKLAADFRRRASDPATWPDCYDYALLNSAIDEMSLRDPDVRGFLGNVHRHYVEEFNKLDVDVLKVAVDRVRRAHALRAIDAMNAHPAQETLIRAEASKSRRHKPLRTLFKDARDVLTAVCPCWMASPLSVSQLIDRGARFDYVIFDEASQVLPEDAVPAIMRGKHVVVAGDNQQLPPTGFFSASVDEDDEQESAVDGFESLLDMMIPFVKSFHLNWHYRSRDEALITFSNHHIYKDRLVTFPGPGGTPALSHQLVDHVPDGDGQEESCAEEVRRVIALVLEHAQTRPHRSLGVITMGIRHAMRLVGALDEALKNRPELAEFFDPERQERFFIKNLERVQGDERDDIILSIGYGKNRAGDLPLRFGPILAAGGRRRLNVAMTRARYSMVVVSSFSWLDINPVKVREGTGLELLRNFLQYAESGGKIIAHDEITSEPMNDFEADVFTALEARGMRLVPQVGCSRFRIDFGVCHPETPGRFVLAIECDGATYHASATARDRDRLRQRMLENLGWRFLRIWSTDWFLRKNEEIDRAWTAYQLALSTPAPPPPSVEPSTLEAPLPTSAASQRTPPAAPIPARSNIGEYSSRELTALYAWVMSDGALRTHDEIADEMFAALPFARRGARIDAVLRATINRCEQQRPH